MRIFGAALVILLVAGAPASGEESRSGFHGDGFGLELSGAMALSSASGGYVGGRRFPQWELALRLRIGEYFSIGVVAETVSKTNEGEEYEEKRQQIGFDLQWRFRLTRVIRPWVGVGMSWGSFERVGTDEFYRFSFHLSEYPSVQSRLRLRGIPQPRHRTIVPCRAGHAARRRVARDRVHDGRGGPESHRRRALSDTVAARVPLT